MRLNLGISEMLVFVQFKKRLCFSFPKFNYIILHHPPTTTFFKAGKKNLNFNK